MRREDVGSKVRKISRRGTDERTGADMMVSFDGQKNIFHTVQSKDIAPDANTTYAAVERDGVDEDCARVPPGNGWFVADTEDL